MAIRCPNCGSFLKKDGTCHCGYKRESDEEIRSMDAALTEAEKEEEREEKEVAAVRTPEIVAAEIIQLTDQTRKLVLNNSIEIGKRLCEAKEMVPAGQWGKWLEENVRFKQSTAQNLMKVYKTYGSAQGELWGASAKSQTFGNLTYSKAVALLAVPDEEREQFIKDNNVDEMSTRQLQEAIKARDEALEKIDSYKEEAENLKHQADAAQEKQKEIEQKLQIANQNLSIKETVLADKNRCIADLTAKASKAEAAGNDAANYKTRIQDLKKSLAYEKTAAQNAKKEVEKLKAELAKPVEMATQKVEVIPEAVQKELEELRAKMAKVGTEEFAIKFKAHFEVFQNAFNTLVGDLAAMGGDDKAKFGNALSALLGKMQESANQSKQ